MKQCTECGKQFDTAGNFCTKCGGKLVDVANSGSLYCQKCGKQLKPGAKFCDSCGKPVSNPFPAGQHDQGSPPSPPKPAVINNLPLHLLNKKVIAALAVLLLVLIGGGVWMFLHRSIEGTWVAEVHQGKDNGYLSLVISQAKDVKVTGGTGNKKILRVQITAGDYKRIPNTPKPTFRLEMSKPEEVGYIEELNPNIYQVVGKSDTRILNYDDKNDTLSFNTNLFWFLGRNPVFIRYKESDFKKLKERMEAYIKNRHIGQEVIFLPEIQK